MPLRNHINPMAGTFRHHCCSHDLGTPVESEKNLLSLRQSIHCTCMAGKVLIATDGDGLEVSKLLSFYVQK